MTRERQFAVWLIGFVVFVAILNLLQAILLPFVAGMLIAYLLDPAADRLERWGCSRPVAVSLILLAFFFAGLAVIVALFPLLQAQAVALIGVVPDMARTLRLRVEPMLEEAWRSLSDEDLTNIRAALGTYALDAARWVAGLLKGLWRGGVAFLDILSLLIITPVVAFYLLRDWDRIVNHLDGLLPRDFAPVIRAQVDAIDEIIARFLRGQASVCLILAAFYAIGLVLVGLRFGLLIGLGAGVISFIPYVGAAVGMLVGLAVAIAQFADWVPVLIVGAIFLTGQTVESYLLTPKLVGESIGLHPVWLIFALMAGGALMGFTGVLIAVPVAAALGVLIRFAVGRYRDSGLYRGDTAGEA